MIRFTPVVAAIALAAAIAPPYLDAEEYELLGTAELTSQTGHYKDSPVVAITDRLDTWDTFGTVRTAFQHRLTLDGAELFVDHAVSARPPGTAGDGGATSGSAGTGDSAAATVELRHELYQGYASIYAADRFTLRAGRQRMNWGAAYTFSVTDALHPQHPDADVETGFDGVSVALRPTPDLSVEVATAIQNAVATADLDDLRYGVYTSAYVPPVEIGATLVYQERTTLRPGIVGSVPIGPVMVVAEGAVEAYDARGQMVDYQPLWSLGGEYTWYGEVTDISLMAEYLYNGLAEHYPDTTLGDIAVTSDYAGGFARRGYGYLTAGAGLNVLESWSTSHEMIANLSDNSAWVSHSLSLLRIPGVDLTTTASWNSGAAGTEFGDLEQDMIVEFTTTVHF